MKPLFDQNLKATQVKASGEEETGHLPLPLRNLAAGAPVSFNIFVKVKPQGQATTKFLPCCAAGEEFQRDWHLKLNKLQIPYVYFAAAELGQVTMYLQSHLEKSISKKDHNEVEMATMVCDAAHLWNLHFFTSEEARTGEQVNRALEFLDSLYEVLEKNRRNLPVLMSIKRLGTRLYSHCLNVSLLGMGFAQYLGWNSVKARTLGLGGLIHDIGISRVPRTILDKPGPLTPQEMSGIKQHPMEGFNMLRNLQVRREVLEMVLHHHENCDGSGYPAGLQFIEINPMARILRIIDSYEAMTAARPWRSAMDARKALWSMRNEWEKKKIYDANLLKAFIKFLAGG